MGRKRKDPNAFSIHPELEGFNVYLDEYGRVQYTKPIEEIIAFLDKNVPDLKLKHKQKCLNSESPNLD